VTAAARGAAPSVLEAAMRSSGFVWLTGLEDTFIVAPHQRTGRTLDEYELTGHYDAWAADLEAAASLGIGAIRYGIPWYRVNPSRGAWDFSFVDSTLERLLELGVEPIVDLVHYGVPAWIDQAFLNGDYPSYVAEYAARIAERFRGRIRTFTPLNEPRITAWYAGMLGHWPPFRRGWRGFLQVLVGVAKGIVTTERALRDVEPELVSVHVDAGDVYVTDDPSLAAEAERRQQIGFLALDLVSGRVDESHPLRRWILDHGVDERTLDWFRERPLELQVVGVNAYPLFSRKVLKRRDRRLRISMPYASADVLERLCELYHARYRVPLLISETATEGSVARRMDWLSSSVAAIEHARERGIPVVGYTWWPMLALVTWAYRAGRKAPDYYLKQMGLWDLRPDAQSRLERVRTPLVDAFSSFAERGVPTATVPAVAWR
jgi:beta-glucosidase